MPKLVDPITCFVGLGNPGQEYEKTRHNVGVWFIQYLIREHHANDLQLATKLKSQQGTVDIEQSRCRLFIPTTFMNECGQAVRAVSDYYDIDPHTLLVAHDDLDLPVGTVRIKFDGGHGGHNGLRDIIQHIGNRQFYRLRIGIGHPGHKNQVLDYVLKPPKKDELTDIEFSLTDALRVVPLLVKGDAEAAMQTLHTTGIA